MRRIAVGVLALGFLSLQLGRANEASESSRPGGSAIPATSAQQRAEDTTNLAQTQRPTARRVMPDSQAQAPGGKEPPQMSLRWVLTGSQAQAVVQRAEPGRPSRPPAPPQESSMPLEPAHKTFQNDAPAGFEVLAKRTPDQLERLGPGMKTFRPLDPAAIGGAVSSPNLPEGPRVVVRRQRIEVKGPAADVALRTAKNVLTLANAEERAIPHDSTASQAEAAPDVAERNQPSETLPAPKGTLEAVPKPNPAFEFLSRPMRSLTINTTCREGDLPADEARAQLAQMRADWNNAGLAGAWYGWEAPGIYYHPLYFEEVNVERYGSSPRYLGWAQPALSAAHFFSNVASLPYQMGAQPPCQYVDPAEHGRPGCPGSYEIPLPPWSWRGLAAESAVALGVVLLFP